MRRDFFHQLLVVPLLLCGATIASAADLKVSSRGPATNATELDVAGRRFNNG
jgi:hypothetical protein